MIGYRIKKKIDDSGMTVNDFAEKMGIRRESAYKIFEKEDVNTSVIKKASQILNVPISYFFAEHDENTSDISDKTLASKNIGETLTKLIEEKNATKTDVAKHIAVARNTLDDYLAGRTFMTSDKIEKIAQYFNVSISYLFGESNTDAISIQQVNAYEREIKRLNELIRSENKQHSHLFLAIPISDDEFLDLREMKDKIIKVLKK